MKYIATIISVLAAIWATVMILNNSVIYHDWKSTLVSILIIIIFWIIVYGFWRGERLQNKFAKESKGAEK